MNESLREKYSKIYDTYNFISIDNKNVWINKRIEYSLLLLNSTKSFIDIYKSVNMKYAKKQCDVMSKSEMDFIQYMFKEFCINNGIDIDKIKIRYTLNYTDVEERMIFRIELYKCGWSINQIEKYLFKNEYDKFSEEKLSRIYHNFMIRREIEREEPIKKVGRPSLPKKIKDYLKNKHQKKLKDIMNNKYMLIKEYREKKKYFFTKNEVEFIKTVINDKLILEKIEHLTI